MLTECVKLIGAKQLINVTIIMKYIKELHQYDGIVYLHVILC